MKEIENILEEIEKPILIGYLNKACISLVSYITPKIGHGVYLFEGKYMVYLTNVDISKPTHSVSYYKDTLGPFINKIKNL